MIEHEIMYILHGVHDMGYGISIDNTCSIIYDQIMQKRANKQRKWHVVRGIGVIKITVHQLNQYKVHIINVQWNFCK